MLHKNAKWIWINSQAKQNEYVVFEECFVFRGSKAVFSIAAETDYILYINGQLAAFGQFAGYPFEKYCDEIDITKLCRKGKNTFTVTVRYEGINSATHIDDGAGVIFSLESDGKLLSYSSEHTLGGYDDRYIQHQNRMITGQLGLTSGMKSGDYKADTPCVEMTKTYNIKKRPVKKTELLDFIEGTPVSSDRKIYDLGREETGYVFLKVRATSQCKIKLAYGEHIADGQVRQLINGRDFSLDFEVSEGEHQFLQLFIRVAARYLEVLADDEVQILSVGLFPALYPLTEKSSFLDGADKDIYDTCVRTLRLCMNTHYEDCPWREQALYVLDSRNQMLCGYYAFEETQFQRENLILISKGLRKDGLLELTYPAVGTPAIPFFSVMYPLAVYEYIKHTSDKSILDETMDTMITIMNTVKDRVEENGLIADFRPPFWNFYEWSEGGARPLPGSGEVYDVKNYHLILNCAYVYCGTLFKEMCQMANIDFDIDVTTVKNAIKKEFFDPQTGLFSLRTDNKNLCSQLGNAFALLIGLGDRRTIQALKHDKTLIPATLSMLGYVYDALIMHDADCKDYILSDIRKQYGYMLRCGATSFWETIDGESAFGNAGSLCHGWSAMPIYYYNLFK